MNYLYQNNVPGMMKFWKLLESMVEENYVTEENEDDYLVFGIVNYWNVEKIKKEYLSGISYRKLIIYQLEPLSSQHWWPAENIINNIQGADEIWDYDLENIEILQRAGLNPKFRPCRYTHSLKRLPHNQDPKIDVLFYGSPTDSRNDYFNHLCNHKTFEWNCAWMTGVHGDVLDYFMSNSKIILNLSTHYEKSRQAQFRIFDALINNKCTISQTSSINYFGDILPKFSNQYDCIYKIESFLQNNLWQNTNIENSHNLFVNPNKIGIFIYIDQIPNWIEDLTNILGTLQVHGLYDNVDWIQISFSGNEILPLDIYKTNRIRYNQTNVIDIVNDTFNFSYLNKDYRVLCINNITDKNFYLSIQNIELWKENIEKLNHHDYVEISNNSFWIHSKIFDNEPLMTFLNFMKDKLGDFIKIKK